MITSKQSKTVCFFNSNQAWGGGEKWHFTTAKEFKHKGYEVIMVTNSSSVLRRKATEHRLNVYSFRISNLSFINPLKILVMAAFFKAKKVDSIILNLPADLKIAGMAAKLAGVKNIIYRRGMPHPLRNTWLNRFLFTKILTHVVVNSQEIGRSLSQGNESWFPKNKMVLVYNGVESNLPLPVAQKFYERKSDEVIIGNAGRLTSQKGQKHLIEMATILKKQGLKFILLIAGEGELKADLQNQIQAANLDQEVKLVGHIEDMASFMNSLDVFVFPSHFEGSANTLIETLHFGIPTIAFDISSNPEIIQNGINGFLVKPFEANELANKVQEIINSPQLKEELIKNGKQTVLEKFDSQKNLMKLEEIMLHA